MAFCPNIIVPHAKELLEQRRVTNGDSQPLDIVLWCFIMGHMSKSTVSFCKPYLVHRTSNLSSCNAPVCVSMCLSVCLLACVYVSECMHICVSVCVTCMYMCLCVCVPVCVWVHVYNHVCVTACVSVYTCVLACMHVCMSVCLPICVCVCACICVSAHVYVNVSVWVVCAHRAFSHINKEFRSCTTSWSILMAVAPLFSWWGKKLNNRTGVKTRCWRV